MLPFVSEGRPERAAELTERYGVEIVDNVEAARRADTLLIVVKPQDVPTVLDEIAPVTRAGQLIISLAAGITTASIESRLPDAVAVASVEDSGQRRQVAQAYRRPGGKPWPAWGGRGRPKSSGCGAAG